MDDEYNGKPEMFFFCPFAFQKCRVCVDIKIFFGGGGDNENVIKKWISVEILGILNCSIRPRITSWYWPFNYKLIYKNLTNIIKSLCINFLFYKIEKMMWLQTFFIPYRSFCVNEILKKSILCFTFSPCFFLNFPFDFVQFVLKNYFPLTNYNDTKWIHWSSIKNLSNSILKLLNFTPQKKDPQFFIFIIQNIILYSMNLPTYINLWSQMKEC